MRWPQEASPPAPPPLEALCEVGWQTSPVSKRQPTSTQLLASCPGFVYKSYFAMGGGGLGGWVFSRVGGSKALDPPPLIILRVFWVGLLPHLLSLVTGALSGCLLVPLSVVSLCRWQVCRWQFFTWRTFF